MIDKVREINDLKFVCRWYT